MTVIRHEIETSCTPDRVWSLLADLEAVQRYNPGFRQAKIQGTARTGGGATRACELVPKGRVVERVTHVEASARGTRISQELEYRVKFGPLGWLLDRLAMERPLRTTLDKIFASLVRHAEAGS